MELSCFPSRLLGHLTVLPRGSDSLASLSPRKLLQGSTELSVGQAACVLVESADDVAAFADYTSESAAEASSTPAASSSSESLSSESVSDAHDESSMTNAESEMTHGRDMHDRIGPAVRMALVNAGLAASDIVKATGPNGIITKGDVMAAVAGGAKSKGAAPQVCTL